MGRGENLQEEVGGVGGRGEWVGSMGKMKTCRG
jgi:hypothetical protein